MSSYASVCVEGFERSRERFEAVACWLAEDTTAGLSHADLEERLQADARELFRQLLQDHLDLRAVREQRRDDVVGEDGVARRHVEEGHQRALVSVFGQVTVTRLAYRAKGYANRYPADAVLNLPVVLHSHGLRRLVVAEAVRGSFEQAATAVARATGVVIGKRQLRQLTTAAAADVDAFYTSRAREGCAGTDALVLTADAKGIVMRPDALREPTRRATAAGGRKLATRLSRGEKLGRKRMAEVVAVYDCTPAPRTPRDVISVPGQPRHKRVAGPKASGKWLHASVTVEAAAVIGAMFDEAARRDLNGQRPWVVLVDGNAHQIEVIRAQAKARGQPCACRIPRPCSSSGMLILVKDTAESVSSAYVEVGDSSSIRDRCGNSP